MPINDSNDIKSLVDALNYFYRETKNEITFEYILFRNFNDSLRDADDLIKLYRQVPADLININARLRKSRGKDIDAACGQLANKN